MSPQHGELEVACDESGYEGDKLIGTTTDVFAHASVALAFESAADCMRELRARIRSPAEEYKANHILRQKHRDVLTWFLGPSSPIRGRAQVFLIDKEYFLVRSLVDVLIPDPSTEDDEVADDRLYVESRPHPGDEPWRRFLVAANDLLRSRGRPEGPASVDAFFQALGLLRGPVVNRLTGARARAEEFQRQPGDDRFDPLTPAIAAAVAHWSTEGHPVVILHDQQNTLSPRRIARLIGSINASGTEHRLVRLDLVDSRWDPRVQVADIVGGAIRKIAQDALNGHEDGELTALLPPFVSAHAIWGDHRSRGIFATSPTLHS
jgi:hypothetical protein